MEQEGRGWGDPGRGGGHGWEVMKKHRLNKMEIWGSRRWPAYQFIIRAEYNGWPRVDTLEGGRAVEGKAQESWRGRDRDGDTVSRVARGVRGLGIR